MSLTLFVTLCVLGCDLLIYFLYQWALGERRRTLMRKAVSRQRTEALANRQPRPTAAAESSAAARRVAVTGAKRQPGPDSRRIANRYSEELPYRRVAPSFAQSKSRA
jgi:hypothetical protein